MSTNFAADAAVAENVFETIHTLMHVFRHQQYRALKDGDHKITHMEHKALGFFGRMPGATLSDLVVHSGRDKAQVARLISGLKEQALLLAQVDEQDRRNQRLYLTETGQVLYAELHLQERRLAELAIADFNPRETEQLLALLQRVKANLGAEVTGDGSGEE